MSRIKAYTSSIEPLEARIAPAAVISYPKLIDAKWRAATVGTPIELHAGEGLSTLGDKAGSYLLFIEQGNALIFTTDYNNNNVVETNEITGIAAGNGLRLISFVDIHGDIVTNLKERQLGGQTFLSLTDSDRNPSNDDPRLLGDGRVILPNTIEKIEFRPLALEDIPDQNNVGLDADLDGVIDGPDETDLALRTVPWSSYSIYGSVLAGGGFGTNKGGLLFNAPASGEFLPTVDAIYVGSATSEKYFSFGAAREYIAGGVKFGDNVNGVTKDFIPGRGDTGGSINTVKGTSKFHLGVLQAGNGGIGGKGGDIRNITMNGDDTGGYSIIAGDGGSGPSGGDGGSVLNFSDIGSTTGLVFVSSGSGGLGATGSGGNAGIGDFGPVNLLGDIHIDLGDGATGFTSGGNGASLSKAAFTEPQLGENATEPVEVKGANGFGTTHYPDSRITDVTDPFNARNIGTHLTLDFDGDGIGDFVYITGGNLTADGSATNSQLIVLYGAKPEDPAYPGYRKIVGPDGSLVNGLSLNGPRNAQALATGDVNGDGHPDIIVASRDDGGSGDIMVFLNKFEDINNDGLSQSEDLDKDGIDDSLGFWEARHSTVPLIATVNMRIDDITVGDFGGNGRPELAVAFYDNDRGFSVMLILTADMEYDPVTQQPEYNGQFYADFGTKSVFTTVGGQPASVPARELIPYEAFNVERLVLEASPFSATSKNDLLFVGLKGKQIVQVYQWIETNDSTARETEFIEPVGSYDMGPDDTNRGIPVVSVPFLLHDITIADLDLDGDADIAGISAPSAGYWFLNTSLGEQITSRFDSAGSVDFYMGLPGSGDGNNAGNAFQFSLNVIRSLDASGDGQADQVVYLHAPNGTTEVTIGFYGPGPDGFFNFPVNGLPTMGTVGDQSQSGFVDSRPIFVGETTPTITAADSTSQSWFSFILAGELVDTAPLQAYAFTMHTGSGGLSLQGRGGNGGFLGGSSTFENIVDPITGAPVIDPLTGLPARDIIGAIDFNTTVNISLLAGNGGDGFSNGGIGGFISGVVIRGGSGHILNAGDGGRGVSALGGAGGSLLSNSIESGGDAGDIAEFYAGNGGDGRIGGAGGSIIGNGTEFYDFKGSAITAYSGSGGLGNRGGGNAGDIRGFHPTIINPTSLSPSYIDYQGGKGGKTVFGKGGNGGSVINSSPTGGVQMGGDVNIVGGPGGDGLAGGAGGSVVKFVNQPDGSSLLFNTEFASFLGGDGGKGTSGLGGAGGSVSGIINPTSGNYQLGILPQFYFERFLFSRAIAGAGGSSSKSIGGVGGSVSDIVATSQFGSWAFVSGAGGGGLHLGGNGGSVSNVNVALGSSTFAKALFVGGEGGNGGAFVPNVEDVAKNQHRNQFGGRIGRGGDGGNVSGITQTNAIAAHIDIIAGNGGDSMHYGTPLDTPRNTFVGKGGSVRNISLAGEAGNIDPAVGLNSYNKLARPGTYDTDQTVAEFVKTTLVSDVGAPVILSDALGNVGVVVGSAGRNKGIILDPVGGPWTYRSLPARYGVSGSLENFTARNLASALAGNVDRIASIQFVKGLFIAQNIGSDKLGGDFLDQFSVPTVSHEPILDGINIDGAVIAKKYLSAAGLSVPPPQNGYIR